MIKLVYCISKRQGLSDAQFSAYWRDVHGPIGAKIPNLRRLVQSRVVRNEQDSAAPAFDGMAELWFDGWDDLLSARSSAAWKASSRDEANFIDGSRTAYFVTQEWEVPLGEA